MNKWIENAKGEKDEEVPEFKVIEKGGNFEVVRREGNSEEVVPEVVFMKRYRAMKKQSDKKKIPKEMGKAILSMVESNPKVQPQRFSQRDRELNETLLHIMRIRNTLEYQYKILSESAINT